MKNDDKIVDLNEKVKEKKSWRIKMAIMRYFVAVF